MVWTILLTEKKKTSVFQHKKCRAPVAASVETFEQSLLNLGQDQRGQTSQVHPSYQTLDW